MHVLEGTCVCTWIWIRPRDVLMSTIDNQCYYAIPAAYLKNASWTMGDFNNEYILVRYFLFSQLIC